MLIFENEPTARPAGEKWDEIKRRLRERLEKDGHETADAMAADVCFSIWHLGLTWLQGLADPGRRDREGTPAEWIKAAKRLEHLAGEMRKCLKGYVPGLLNWHLAGKLSPHGSARDDEGRIILGSRECRSPPDVAELLSLFEGFAASVQGNLKSGPGSYGDPMARSRRLHFAAQLANLFNEYRLPIATAEGSFLPRIARLTYEAFGIKADARDNICAVLAPMAGEQPKHTPEPPSATGGQETPTPTVRAWWGGELPE